MAKKKGGYKRRYKTKQQATFEWARATPCTIFPNLQPVADFAVADFFSQWDTYSKLAVKEGPKANTTKRVKAKDAIPNWHGLRASMLNGYYILEAMINNYLEGK